jgi:5-methylcytosine-specific restriction endonuclease McrA
MAKELSYRGKVYTSWSAAKRAWHKQNPPNFQGYYICHYCGVWIERKATSLDHLIARSRAPELRFELSNLVPACISCNTTKGSLDHDEYKHVCSFDNIST